MAHKVTIDGVEYVARDDIRERMKERVMVLLHSQQDGDIQEATRTPEDGDLEFARDPHTAWQWVSRGYVPIAEAEWRLGGGPAWDYYYAAAWDVRWDPERAKALEETGPREVDKLPDGRPYVGLPWWQDRADLLTTVADDDDF